MSRLLATVRVALLHPTQVGKLFSAMVSLLSFAVGVTHDLAVDLINHRRKKSLEGSSFRMKIADYVFILLVIHYNMGISDCFK